MCRIVTRLCRAFSRVSWISSGGYAARKEARCELIVRPDMSKTLIRHMRDILVALIEEASPIPSGVMDCIIARFEAQVEVSLAIPYGRSAELTYYRRPIPQRFCSFRMFATVQAPNSLERSTQ